MQGSHAGDTSKSLLVRSVCSNSPVAVQLRDKASRFIRFSKLSVQNLRCLHLHLYSAHNIPYIIFCLAHCLYSHLLIPCPAAFFASFPLFCSMSPFLSHYNAISLQILNKSPTYPPTHTGCFCRHLTLCLKRP